MTLAPEMPSCKLMAAVTSTQEPHSCLAIELIEHMQKALFDRSSNESLAQLIDPICTLGHLKFCLLRLFLSCGYEKFNFKVQGHTPAPWSLPNSATVPSSGKPGAL